MFWRLQSHCQMCRRKLFEIMYHVTMSACWNLIFNYTYKIRKKYMKVSLWYLNFVPIVIFSKTYQFFFPVNYIFFPVLPNIAFHFSPKLSLCIMVCFYIYWKLQLLSFKVCQLPQTLIKKFSTYSATNITRLPCKKKHKSVITTMAK
jgi:hypothetical protein